MCIIILVHFYFGIMLSNKQVGKMHRTCDICEKSVVNLSSHMIRVHHTKQRDMPNPIVHKDITIANGGTSTTTVDDGANTPNSLMDSTRARNYLHLLQQFVSMRLHDKRLYIKQRAPDSFIRLLRECIRNVRNGNVPSDESLVSKCKYQYNCKRIDDNTATHSEARKHLCDIKMLDLLFGVLTYVMQYLSSF